MKRWLRRGRIPDSCSEAEDLTEGPAMCITHQSTNHSGSTEMIVGGALGFDGKPVRIKVGLPVNFQSMLKKGRKKKSRRNARSGDKRKISKSDVKINGQKSRRDVGNGEMVYSEEELLDSNSSDEGDDMFDMPDSFRKYILKKAIKKSSPSKSTRSLNVLRPEHEEQKGSSLFNEWSLSDFTTSSLSSLASKVDSEELLKYIESGDSYSGDEFLSDEYSFDSQLDFLGGENASKPFKKPKPLKRIVQSGRSSSFDGSMEMLYSGDNVPHSASTNPQSKVRNHTEVSKQRSRSFPDPQSSGTCLPPIRGVPSSQSTSKYSSWKRPRGNLNSNARLAAKASDEDGNFGILQGRSFDGMVPKINSFINDEDVSSSRQRTEKEFNKDTEKDADKLGANTRSRTRGKERRRNQNGSAVQNAGNNGLHLPSIVDGNSPSTTPTATSNQNSSDGSQNSKQQDKLRSQTSQSVRLPQLSKDRGIIAQHHNVDESLHDREVARDTAENTDSDLQGTDDGLPASESMVNVPDSPAQGYQDDHRLLNSMASENGSGVESKSHAQFVLNCGVSQSVVSAQSSDVVSGAMGNRRGSVQTPSFLVQDRRPSRVSHATVKEDIELPVVRSNRNRVRPPLRQRNKRSEEMPLLKKLSENNLNKTLSSHLPDKSELSRHQSMEMKSFHGDDNIPRRIGHKLVKKRKGDEQPRDSIMHNSKDIGNVVEGVDPASHGSKVSAAQNPGSRRPSAFLSIEEDSNTISSQSPLSTSLRANQDPSSSFGYNSVVNMGGGSGAKLRPTSGGMGSKLSSNYPPGSSLLQQENNSDTSSPIIPPVRLKPLDPTQIVSSDPNASNGLQPPQVIVVQDQMGEAEQGISGSTNGNPSTEGDKVGEGEEGLEAIIEESEPESSDDDDEYFDIRPIPELKPVSTLSFSSNVFSYFPMGKAHKQAYQAVHQKAVGGTPVKKWGRSQRTPAKMAKRRKR